MSRYADNRGFTLTEFALTLALVSLIMLGVVKLTNAYRMQAQVSQQSYNIQMLAIAIKNNAKLIMDSAGTVCTQITAAYANDTWGWRHPSCLNTSPFPVFNIAPTNTLVYNIDTASFSGAVAFIIQNVGPFCKYTGQTATTVTFDCSGLNVQGIQYQTSSGPTTNTVANTVPVFSVPHTNNTNADFLNFLDFPSSVYIQYNVYVSSAGQTITHTDMTNATGDIDHGAYPLNFTDLLLDRQKKTRDNIIALDSALRDYAIGNMTSEFENVPPTGLASNDGFFVPWIWQSLASTPANANVLCNNTSCASIIAGAQWATAAQVTRFAQVWMLITSNILSSNLSYVADAFGNPLRLLPIANNCTGDATSCTPSQNLPPVPQQNYLTALVGQGYAPRPPYTSLIVSPLCLTSTANPDYCRWTVVYPN